MKEYLKWYALILFGLTLSGLSAQSAIVSTGGDVLSNGSLSYSVGQLVGETYKGTNGSLSMGVQQPFEIQIVNGIKDTRISLSMQAFPNPTTDYLTLMADNFDFTHATIQLYDMEGRLLWHKAMATNEARISLQDFTAAIYILRIMDNQKEIKSFKIIKK